MNNVSNVPYFVKYYIQQSNIKKRVAKVLDYSEKQEEQEQEKEKEELLEKEVSP
jgi:hypothetical protein